MPTTTSHTAVATTTPDSYLSELHNNWIHVQSVQTFTISPAVIWGAYTAPGLGAIPFDRAVVAQIGNSEKPAGNTTLVCLGSSHYDKALTPNVYSGPAISTEQALARLHNGYTLVAAEADIS